MIIQRRSRLVLCHFHKQIAVERLFANSLFKSVLALEETGFIFILSVNRGYNRRLNTVFDVFWIVNPIVNMIPFLDMAQSERVIRYSEARLPPK